MRFGEWAMEDSLPAEQTNRQGCTPCQAPWPTGASLMPVGKGHFLGHQAGCTGRAVPCFVSHLVRLAGDFFCTQTAAPDFAVSPNGCVRGCREAGKGARPVQGGMETLKGNVTGRLHSCEMNQPVVLGKR